MTKKTYLLVTVAVIVAAAILWWWMRPPKTEAPTLDNTSSETQSDPEIADMMAELDAAVIGDLSAEFESIDSDLNSL